MLPGGSTELHNLQENSSCSRTMAGLWRFTQRPRFCFIICVSAVLLLLLFSQAFRPRQQKERHKRDFIESTEIPADHFDPAAIDLTPLVNTLINSSQSGSRQLFSLLSVTSYSSLALHKLTLLVYNISSIRSLESNMFRRRFCYCVTNETNDLTDFTAILLDVMGNSTSYLHELFKSSSILSVSQRNNSDCIYICVMAGKMGREVPDLWEVDSITPLFNQTIVEGPHQVANISSFRLPFEWHQLPTNLSHITPSGMSSALTSRVQSTAHTSPPTLDETAATKEKVTAAREPTTVAPQSQTTAARPESTRAGTTQRVTTRTLTAQRATTPTAATTWTQTAAKTTLLPQITTSKQPTTAAPAVTAAAPTTVKARSTAVPPHLTAATPPEAATSSPAISLTRLTAATSAATQRTTSTVPPARLSPARLTVAPTVARRTTGPLGRRTTTPSKPVETEKPGCPWRRSEVTGEAASGGGGGGSTTVGAHKLQPCVLELCKFFSQCLCRPFGHKTRMKRYCDDSHLWYEKHTSEVCRRVRRVSFSRNLKQRCLTKMCNKL
ncbi:HERV-H LTR-associating protein 1 [Brachyistius frenatus]|uniref:HERV-H LTR-associating protein 1 n=1 Tax=Brachyistius frenatus TaxID=100188 RepID=UPI0037E73B49